MRLLESVPLAEACIKKAKQYTREANRHLKNADTLIGFLKGEDVLTSMPATEVYPDVAEAADIEIEKAYDQLSISEGLNTFVSSLDKIPYQNN